MTKSIVPQSDDIFQRINDEVKIRDALPLFISPVRRGGKDLYLCPFHDDHRPSATIYDKVNKLKCFSCGKSADLIEVVCQLYGLKPIGSAMLVAERLGLTTDKGRLKPLSLEQRLEIHKRQERGELERGWSQGVDVVFRMATDMRDALLAITTPEDAGGDTLEALVQLELLIDVLIEGDRERILASLEGCSL